ncbi:MAG: L-threonylcarbamoyladenylate synthase [Patescibacteria group bacterium]
MFIKNRVDIAIVKAIKSGGIGIIPTDTIYGIVGSALLRNTVKKIYELRKRNPRKPMVVLIGSVRDLNVFGVKPNLIVKKQIRKLWPGEISVILPCASKKFAYLHRGTKTIAFRLPANARLRKLLKKTGPLVAPSANMEGKPPARTISQARAYFGDRVDFYLDVGRVFSRPSKLVKIKDGGRIEIIRK